MNIENELGIVDEKQAATMMCRSVQTLRNERHKRIGCPYLKIGRSVRYMLSDIHDFLAERRIDPEGSQN